MVEDDRSGLGRGAQCDLSGKASGVTGDTEVTEVTWGCNERYRGFRLQINGANAYDNAGDDNKQRFSLVFEFARLPLGYPASKIKLPRKRKGILTRSTVDFVDSKFPLGDMANKDR